MCARPGDDCSAGVRQAGRRLLSRSAPDAKNPGAFGSQKDGCGKPDAAARPRDDGDAAVEAQIHERQLSLATGARL